MVKRKLQATTFLNAKKDTLLSFQINSSDDGMVKLKFFRDILSPIIESYWFVALSLLSLCDDQHNGKLCYTMSIALWIYHNASS
jgi:hypothetical protein